MACALMRRVGFAVGAAALLGSLAVSADAVTIEWVTVGDPGNAADTSGSPSPAGGVDEAFQIMKFEFTNQQYAEFLNSVAATDTYSLYSTNMATNSGRGGITRSGSAGSYSYTVRANMGDKPVNSVSWWDAARVCNWLQNGATGTSSTETGAYTLSGGTSGNAPARNPGATYYLPTQNQWYKAAYYKGGGTNAGYWTYATQSNTDPTAVTANSTGIGSSGSAGNSANYNNAASWANQTGFVTSVGTNGGPSAYGAFDMSGNVREWNDLDGLPSSSRGLRGGAWSFAAPNLSTSTGNSFAATTEGTNNGFRLAAPVAVPEPTTSIMALAGLVCGGYSMWRWRKRA